MMNKRQFFSMLHKYFRNLSQKKVLHVFFSLRKRLLLFKKPKCCRMIKHCEAMTKTDRHYHVNPHQRLFIVYRPIYIQYIYIFFFVISSHLIAA